MIVAVMLTGAAAHAQAPASPSGTVADATGAALVGVTITQWPRVFDSIVDPAEEWDLIEPPLCASCASCPS